MAKLNGYLYELFGAIIIPDMVMGLKYCGRIYYMYVEYICCPCGGTQVALGQTMIFYFNVITTLGSSSFCESKNLCTSNRTNNCW